MEDPDNDDNKTCYSCGKTFHTPTDLIRHKNRKTPCLIRDIKPEDIKNPKRCIYCNIIFSTIGNLTKHGKTCKIKNGGLQMLHDKVKHEEMTRIKFEEMEIKNKDIEGILSVMKAQNDELNAKMDNIMAENKQLRADLSNVSGNGGITGSNNNNNNINNTTNNTINITINNYNKPSIEHLKDVDAFSKLLNYELAGTPMALVNKIWYDPDHPENIAIHLVNKKTGETLVIIGNKWITDNTANIIPQIRHIVYEFTREMIRHNYDRLINFGNDMVPRFLANCNKNENVLKQDTEEILQKLIDGRKISQARVDATY
jgi:hypothetical protein